MPEMQDIFKLYGDEYIANPIPRFAVVVVFVTPPF